MRKVSLAQILVFVALFTSACFLALGSTRLALEPLSLGEYHVLAKAVCFVCMLYVWAILLFRAFMAIFPLPTGEIPENSRGEFAYHIHLLFFLILFHPVIRGSFLPVPLMRLFYQALGAKLGHNTYSSGLILDPLFVEMGSNCLVGQFAIICPHALEGTKLSHHPIKIGNNVTIGIGAVVFPGVTIGDDALVAAGAIVSKGTVIGAGEIWGGIPAKLITRKKIVGLVPADLEVAKVAV